MNVETTTIKLINASLNYGTKIIYAHLDLSIMAGDWVGLLGPSGIGKSSLLRTIAGLIPGYPHSNLDIAYMGQTDLLLPWLKVIDNATLNLKLRSHTRAEQKILREKAIMLLEQVGLGASLNDYPATLSGGMRQRVALVRTLLENKPIILMDEPFSALDAITRHKLQHLAVTLLTGKTVFFITHEPTEALRIANKIYIMQGTPATLKCVAHLSSETPRSLLDPELIKLQAQLFEELSLAVDGTL